jgi:hypothetical protein
MRICKCGRKLLSAGRTLCPACEAYAVYAKKGGLVRGISTWAIRFVIVVAVLVAVYRYVACY